MDKTQKRWSFIVNIIYFSIFIIAFYFFMKYAFWMFFPFIVAFIISALLQKPLKFLTKNEKVPKGFVSVILSLLVFAVIGGLIGLGGARLIFSIKDLITYFTDRCSNFAEFFDVLKTGYLNLEIAHRVPGEINDYVTNAIDSVAAYFISGDIMKTITENISKLASPLGSVITTVPSILAGVLVSVVATCFMTVSFDDMKAFILRQFDNEKKEKVIRTKHILVSSIGKMFKAYGLIIIITTFELSVGLYALKILGINDGSHIILISIIIALIDIVPVLGTGTVMIPWSIYSFVTGEIGMGIGLLVIYAIISVIRQIIEPKLVAGQVGISPIITIIAMYIGIKVFGAIGIFILPFIVIIIKLLNDEGIIHIFNSNPKDIRHDDETVQQKDKNGNGGDVL